MKYYLLKFNEDYADEHDVPALACFTEDEFEEWKLKSSYDDEDECSTICAYLGNSGDGFGESFNELNFMSEFIEAGYVEVFEVDENFYNLFHKAKLSDVSLCNIFDL